MNIIHLYGAKKIVYVRRQIIAIATAIKPVKTVKIYGHINVMSCNCIYSCAENMREIHLFDQIKICQSNTRFVKCVSNFWCICMQKMQKMSQHFEKYEFRCLCLSISFFLSFSLLIVDSHNSASPSKMWYFYDKMPDSSSNIYVNHTRINMLCETTINIELICTMQWNRLLLVLFQFECKIIDCYHLIRKRNTHTHTHRFKYVSHSNA